MELPIGLTVTLLGIHLLFVLWSSTTTCTRAASAMADIMHCPPWLQFSALFIGAVDLSLVKYTWANLTRQVQYLEWLYVVGMIRLPPRYFYFFMGWTD